MLSHHQRQNDEHYTVNTFGGINTTCRCKHKQHSHKLLNMSRVEIVLVLMNDGEYDSGFLIRSSRHGNTDFHELYIQITEGRNTLFISGRRKCLSLVDTKQRKDQSIYSSVQALNGSPNHPPAIEMAHQFNYFTTQVRPLLSESWHWKFPVALYL